MAKNEILEIIELFKHPLFLGIWALELIYLINLLLIDKLKYMKVPVSFCTLLILMIVPTFALQADAKVGAAPAVTSKQISPEELDKQVALREKAAAAKAAAFAAKDKDLDTQVKALNSKERIIRNNEVSLFAQERALAAKEPPTLEMRKKALAAKEKNLLAKAKAIAAKEKLVKLKQKLVATKEKKLDARKKTVATRSMKLGGKDKKLQINSSERLKTKLQKNTIKPRPSSPIPPMRKYR